MNTPSVDAEGVFFASGHTRRPAPEPYDEGEQARPRACARDSASAVRALRVVLRVPLSPPAPASSLFVARNRREYYKLRPAKKFRQSIEMLPL